MMKRHLFSILSLMPLAVTAQVSGETEVKDSVSLSEVVVSAARVRNTAEGLRYMPDKNVLERSNNAYSLLDKLALPGVKVDVAQRSISVPGIMGTLQIRINDVVATMQDLLALDPKSVRHVDYIRNPGTRYGHDVDVVIAIVTNRASSGYSVGGDVFQTLTSWRGDDNVFFRLNKGKSEFGIDYGFSYTDLKDGEYTETADYLMPSGETYSILRREYDMHSETRNHNIKLRYSIADSGRYTFLAALSGAFLKTPKDFARRKETAGGIENDFPVTVKDRSSSPVLDLYFTAKLSERQSVTASATGTYVNSTYDYMYSSAVPYAYSSKGRTWSLASEAIYENRLKPFTLSAGVRYNLSYVRNEYTGDTSALNSIHTSDTYAFASLKGRAGALAYTGGAGISRLYYSQGAHGYEYWLLRPQFTLSYSLPWNLGIKYNISISDRAPLLEFLGDVETRTNTMEASLGNASLKPTRRVEQTVTLSLQKPALYAEVMAMYRRNLHCRMPLTYHRENIDGTCDFVTTQTNNGHIDYLFLYGYVHWDAIKDKLTLTGSPSMGRCLNYGPDYKHHYTALSCNAGITSYLGRFTLTANFDSGMSYLEGENKTKEHAAWYGSVSYKLGAADISLIWQHLFSARPVVMETEYLTRYAHRNISYRRGDFGNMVSVDISWNISRGRKYKSVEHRNSPSYTDTGIRKVGKK